MSLESQKKLLFYGNNLGVLKTRIESNSIELIYLDPPYIQASSSRIRASAHFMQGSSDTVGPSENAWREDSNKAVAHEELEKKDRQLAQVVQLTKSSLDPTELLPHLDELALILVEARRTLTDTGTIFLHCTPITSHYLKLLMDAAFGSKNFRNDIILTRRIAATRSAPQQGMLPVVTENILFYSKSSKARLNVINQEPTHHTLSKYPHIDSDGRRYRFTSLSASSSAAHRGFGYTYRGIHPPRNGWSVSRERMEQLETAGLLEVSHQRQSIRKKQYLEESVRIQTDNAWDDIPSVARAHINDIAYPTQKPLALLERVITLSSAPGDTILDPFCGSGTTLIAAEKHGRKWIGIDSSYEAINISRARIRQICGMNTRFDVFGEPSTPAEAEALSRTDPNHFIGWALGALGAYPASLTTGASAEVDGWINIGTEGNSFRIAVEVKAGSISESTIDELKRLLKHGYADACILLAVEDPRPQLKAKTLEAGTLHLPHGSFSRIELLTIKELLKGRYPSYLNPSPLSGEFREPPQQGFERKSEQKDTRNRTKPSKTARRVTQEESSIVSGSETGRKMQKLLLEDARLSQSEAIRRLHAALVEDQPSLASSLEQVQTENFDEWILVVLQMVPQRELLHYASLIRNSIVHDADARWRLR